MEENEVLVRVEGLSKKFCKDLRTSLWYGVKDLFQILSGNKAERHLRKEEFWALKDISFELRRGECLGLIGHNGAGKSTLLKILNGLIMPDAGKVIMKGRVGALIELGAGFNPILSGRENIYNNGAILGFSRKEIDEKLEEIIDFAEIREFIDMPVQHYSSGMKVRLGFAVAAQMEPDVLIIDEVLAVGDVGFRMKCLTKIGALLKNTAVIFVSHSMPQIARISNQLLLLSKGKKVYHSNEIGTGIEKYYGLFDTSDKIVGGNQKIKLKNFKILDSSRSAITSKNEDYCLNYNSDYIFQLELKVANDVTDYFVNYSIIDKDTKMVANIFSMISTSTFNGKGNIKIEAHIKNLILALGKYTIGVAVNEIRKDGSRGEIYLYNSNIAIVVLNGVIASHAPIQFNAKWFETKLLHE